jgi:hypothetical protein
MAPTSGELGTDVRRRVDGESRWRRRWCHRPGLDRDVAQERQARGLRAEDVGGNPDAERALVSALGLAEREPHQLGTRRARRGAAAGRRRIAAWDRIQLVALDRDIAQAEDLDAEHRPRPAGSGGGSLARARTYLTGPQQPNSGGKLLKKRRNSLGANRIRGSVAHAAVSLQRSKTFRRIARHKGHAVAVFAIARKLTQLIYRMLRYGQGYVDIGEEAYEAQFEARRLASLKEAARGHGYTLVQEPLADG